MGTGQETSMCGVNDHLRENGKTGRNGDYVNERGIGEIIQSDRQREMCRGELHQFKPFQDQLLGQHPMISQC